MTYKETEALSYSGAKQILKSPAHFKAWLTAEQKDTPALKMGRLIHLSALQQEEFQRVVHVQPDLDRRTKDGKAAYEAFKADLPADAEIVDADDMATIQGVTASVQAAFLHLEIDKSLYEAEKPIFGVYNGVNIKGRLDLITKIRGCEAPYIIDVKSCEDASPAAFARDIANYGYHVQQAFYSTLAETGRNYLIVAVEKKPPFAWRIYSLSEETIKAGQELMDIAVNTYKMSNAFGNWRGYNPDATEISIPKWALNPDVIS